MKLKVRYENKFQTIELDAKSMDKMWVSLSLESDDNLTQEEKEMMIQEVFEKKFNKPEYNSWHKFDRHRGYSKAKPNDETDELNISEPLMVEVMDPRIFCKEEFEQNNRYEYQALCQKIRTVLKPEFAKVIIAVFLDDMTPEEYAASTGEKRDTVYKRLQRAKKKFENFYKSVQSAPLPRLLARGATSNKLQEVIQMSELQIFKNAEFGSVRTLAINGEPYFAGKDVAAILGDSNPRDALAKHVDDEDKGVAKCDTPGGTQELTFINESGLYSLILSSKMPNAKKFKRWVTSEVLPAIRKHGIYAVDEVLNNPDMLIVALTELKAEREKTKALMETVAVQGQQIIEMKPKASYYDVVLNCKDLVPISVIAKDYSWSANRMNKYLHEKGVQYKQGNEIWLLYQKYAQMDYTNTKTHSYPGSDGSMHTAVHTY